MAGEISHVVYGDTVLTALKKPREVPEFWIGTLFPDIGHIGAPSRRRTHPEDVSVNNLEASSDFATGLRVHAWIDTTREVYLRDHNMKEKLYWHPFVPHALKLLEDELIYDLFNDWNLVLRSLNTISDEEQKYVTSDDTIQRWHTILQNYLKQKPTEITRHQLSVDIGLSKASATEVNTVVRRLKNDIDATKFIDGFHRHLESTLR